MSICLRRHYALKLFKFNFMHDLQIGISASWSPPVNERWRNTWPLETERKSGRRRDRAVFGVAAARRNRIENNPSKREGGRRDGALPRAQRHRTAVPHTFGACTFYFHNAFLSIGMLGARSTGTDQTIKSRCRLARPSGRRLPNQLKRPWSARFLIQDMARDYFERRRVHRLNTFKCIIEKRVALGGGPRLSK